MGADRVPDGIYLRGRKSGPFKNRIHDTGSLVGMVYALLISVPRSERRHVVEIGRSKEHVIIEGRMVGLGQVFGQLVVPDRMRVSPSWILKVLSSKLPHHLPPSSLLGNSSCNNAATRG